MDLQAFTVSATAARQQLFGGSDEPSPLQPFLGIQPPARSSGTPPVLSFHRKRRVELPWDEILGSATLAGETSIASIREYFEASWGVGTIDKASLSSIVEGDAGRIKSLQTAGKDGKGNPAPLKMFRAQLPGSSPGGTAAAATVDSGLIVQHGTSGRWYLMVPRTGDALSAADIASLPAYAALWADKVDGVELVFESAATAEHGATQFSEVDLRPRVIHRAFNELLIRKDFADNVSKRAAEATTAAIEKIIGTTLAIDELQRLQERSFQLQMQAYEAKRHLERLVSQAADLGYYLFLEPMDFVFPGTTAKTTVKPGEIHTQFKRTATWVTTHQRTVTQSTGWWIFKGSKKVRQTYTQPHAAVVTDYKKVDTARDPLVEAVADRRARGMAVFVFEPGPTGFVTADGVPLAEVMGQCDRNEAFRLSCAVMLPVVEESLTGERVLTKYSVFERPLPGISPSALPQFSLLESLSYRTAWVESQLGEVVSAINLAPGEERTVVLTRSFERESTVTQSSTSIFDISRSDTSDLATEMENQARREGETSSTMNVSASGKASYGLFSAEASASAGSSSSLKTFSQAVSKVAKKASQAINQQNREEVSTSSSVKTTVSSKDETTATLRNINQGRTLNLLFYRLNNRFEGGIYLDDLAFEVIPGTEIIAGSGVYESLRYSLDRLQALLEQFRVTRLPFDIVPDAGGSTDWLAQVAGSLKTLLEAEYIGTAQPQPQGLPKGARSLAASAPEASASVARLSLGSAPPRAPQPRVRTRAIGTAAIAPGSELAEFVERLKTATIDRQTAILPDELILSSGGLYLDAAVGVQPSTEPYSEEMRAQEIRMRDAEVRKTLAEAEHHLAQVGGGAEGSGGNAIVGLVADTTGKSLQLVLRVPLVAGQWDLLLEGSRKGTVARHADGSRNVSFQWPRKQDWLDATTLTGRIALEERGTRERVEFAG